MAGKKVDTMEDIVARGMAEFGKLDESITETEESSINVFATQEAKQVATPAQATVTRSSWVIPGKKKAEPEPEPVVEEPQPVEEEPVEPEEPQPFRAAPTSGAGEWDTAFTPEPEPTPVPEMPAIPKPRIVKEPDSTDLGVEW